MCAPVLLFQMCNVELGLREIKTTSIDVLLPAFMVAVVISLLISLKYHFKLKLHQL